MTNELKLVENTEPRIETRKTLRFEYKSGEHTIQVTKIGEEYLLMVNDGDYILMNESQLSMLAQLIDEII